MYGGGNEAYKSNFLFKLMQNDKTQCITNGSTKLLRALESMTVITCIVMSDGLIKMLDEQQDLFKVKDEELFEELHHLFTKDPIMLKEFAQYINQTLLFPEQPLERESESINTSKRS